MTVPFCEVFGAGAVALSVPSFETSSRRGFPPKRTCGLERAWPKTSPKRWKAGTTIPIESRSASSRATTVARRFNCASTWGLLQMEFDGRPDGKRVGRLCLVARLLPAQAAGSASRRIPTATPFVLDSEDCVRLLREGVQYYHRYISFWHLERYELCARDTSRNLRLFAFVREYAQHTKDKLQFDQWRPYVTMMHARAVATPLVGLKDYRRGSGRHRRGHRGDSRLSQGVRPVAECGELQRAGLSAALARGDCFETFGRRSGRRSPMIRSSACRPSWNKRSAKSDSRTPPGCATRFASIPRVRAPARAIRCRNDSSLELVSRPVWERGTVSDRFETSSGRSQSSSGPPGPLRAIKGPVAAVNQAARHPDVALPRRSSARRRRKFDTQKVAI